MDEITVNYGEGGEVLSVTFSEDGESVILDGPLPADMAAMIQKIARQRKIPFEDALKLALRTGVKAMNGVQPTDGQSRPRR